MYNEKKWIFEKSIFATNKYIRMRKNFKQNLEKRKIITEKEKKTSRNVWE